MQRIRCACSGSIEKLSKPWLPNLLKTQQPRYVIEPETCKYSLLEYDLWNVSILFFNLLFGLHDQARFL